MDLWTEASRDHLAEHRARQFASARLRVAKVWPFLAVAKDVQEFSLRKAIATADIDSAVAEETGGFEGEYASLRTAIEASLDDDFQVLHASRQPERDALAVTAALAAGDVIQNNTGKAYNDAYEGGFQRGTLHKQQGVPSEFQWPRDGDRYMREPDVEGYLDAYGTDGARSAGLHRLGAVGVCAHCNGGLHTEHLTDVSDLGDFSGDNWHHNDPSKDLDHTAQPTQVMHGSKVGAVSDEDHAVLDAAWRQSFDALRGAGLEADADHPIAAAYRAASNAVNHANRSRDFNIANGGTTAAFGDDQPPAVDPAAAPVAPAPPVPAAADAAPAPIDGQPMNPDYAAYVALCAAAGTDPLPPDQWEAQGQPQGPETPSVAAPSTPPIGATLDPAPDAQAQITPSEDDKFASLAAIVRQAFDDDDDGAGIGDDESPIKTTPLSSESGADAPFSQAATAAFHREAAIIQPRSGGADGSHSINVLTSRDSDGSNEMHMGVCLSCPWKGHLHDNYGDALKEASDHRNQRPLPQNFFGDPDAVRGSLHTAKDGDTAVCGTCGKPIQQMDYAWYHLRQPGDPTVEPAGGHNAHPSPHVGAKTADYHYVKKDGSDWVITQKGTGKILSRHPSQEEAEAAFRAMESHMHGSLDDSFAKIAGEVDLHCDKCGTYGSSASGDAAGAVCPLCGKGHFVPTSMGKAAARIDTLHQIVDSHQHQKVDGMLVDPTTANMLIQVHDALKEQRNRDKFETVPLPRLVDLGWKHLKPALDGGKFSSILDGSDMFDDLEPAPSVDAVQASTRPISHIACRKCLGGKTPDGAACNYCEGAGRLSLTMAVIKEADGYSQGITAQAFRRESWMDFPTVKRVAPTLHGHHVVMTYNDDYGVNTVAGPLTMQGEHAVVTSPSNRQVAIPLAEVLDLHASSRDNPQPPNEFLPMPEQQGRDHGNIVDYMAHGLIDRGHMGRLAYTMEGDEQTADPVACDHYEPSLEFPGSCKNCLWSIGSHSVAAGGPDGHGGFGRQGAAPNFDPSYRQDFLPGANPYATEAQNAASTPNMPAPPQMPGAAMMPQDSMAGGGAPGIGLDALTPKTTRPRAMPSGGSGSAVTQGFSSLVTAQDMFMEPPSNQEAYKEKVSEIAEDVMANNPAMAPAQAMQVAQAVLATFPGTV